MKTSTPLLSPRRAGGQKRNRNAQVYDEPMRRTKVFRVTESQDQAIEEMCEARKVDFSEQARALMLKWAGVEGA